MQFQTKAGLNMESRYILQKVEKSYCPKCHHLVYLLCDGDFKKGKPAFYICFDCKYIGEVGVGAVKSEA